jgi:hypothetical protein
VSAFGGKSDMPATYGTSLKFPFSNDAFIWFIDTSHAILELAIMLWQYFRDDVCTSRNALARGGGEKYSLTDLEFISRHNTPSAYYNWWRVTHRSDPLNKDRPMPRPLLCPICKSAVQELDRTGDATGYACAMHGNFKVADSVFAEAKARTTPESNGKPHWTTQSNERSLTDGL